MHWKLGKLARAMAFGLAAMAVAFGGLTSDVQAQNSLPRTEAEIAEAVARLHPVAPDIRLPTRGELSLIYSTADQALTPEGSFLRISGYKRLIEELKNSFGPEHPLVGALELRYANELAAAQELEEAEAALNRARAIIEARTPADDLFRLLVHSTEQYLMDQRGDHIAMLADAKEMLRRADSEFKGNVDAQIMSLQSLGIAHIRVGNYDEAVRLGEQTIALTQGRDPEPNGRLSSAIAAQVQRLVAAGRLSEAKTLIETRGGTEHLDELRDRYVIAGLAKARGAVFEAELMFEDAMREYETAYRIHSATDFMNTTSGGISIPPDKGTFPAVRAALDLKRVEVRKFNSPAMLSATSADAYWIELDLGVDDSVFGDGPVLSTHSLQRYTPFRITGPLQEMAAQYNGYAYALGNADHDLAESFWREVVAYSARSSGERSVRTGEALVDLAGGLMVALRPFAAREEALKAIAILEGQLPETHPTMIRARALAALALSGQGRGELAIPEIDAALEAAWTNPLQTKRELLALLVERDLQFQRQRDDAARAAFWDTWRDRIFEINPGTGLVELERLAMVFVAVNQSMVDGGECPPDDLVDQLFETRETLLAADALDTFRMSDGPVTYTLLLTDQAIAEALVCKPQRGMTLPGFLADLRTNQRYSTVRKSSQSITARNERYARLLSQTEAFGQDPATTELAIDFAADAAFTANFEITKARGLGEVATTDDRQARVLAGEGAGFDVRYGLETQLDVLWRASQANFARGPVDEDDFDERFYRTLKFDAAFKAAQLLRIDGNSQTLALASARAAAPNPELRETVAAYQSLSAELFRELSISTQPTEKLTDLQERHAALDDTIRKDFPAYYEFAAPQPLGIFDARDALDDNEGLLTIITVGDDIYVFAVSKSNGEAWHRVSGKARDVEDMIAILRCEVDPIECGLGAKVQTRGGSSTSEIGNWEGFNFDRNVAFELYETLIAPVAHVIESDYDFARVERLYAVTSGAISALPLSLLITEKPSDDGVNTSGSVFIDAPWFSDRYDVAYLPSVSDLKGTQSKLEASGGFVGYGDPVLGPPVAGATKGYDGSSVFGVKRGTGGQPLADPASLLKMSSLPGAELELAAVARLFPESSRLVTKAAATEPAIKRDARLSGAQVILFSTHGVLADPALGNAEPGLVMTPPAEPSEMDDGLLSASEAAALDFTSELLILSACNTATEGSFSGADSLSGLARAFIFAGARSVYASHWQVSDTITKELIFAAVDIALREPEISRSQALAKAMWAIRTGKYEDGREIDGWDPDWSHPSAWAPFVAIIARERNEME